MDAELLAIARKGLARIRKDHETPIAVAHDLLAEVPRKHMKELAAMGLAEIIYQAMAQERRKPIEAVVPPKAPIGENVAEKKAREERDAQEQAKRDLAFQEEIEAILGDFRTHVEHQAVEKLRAIMLQAADGSMRSLLDFTYADLDKWDISAERRSLAWERRSIWFREAKETLQDHEVKAISDLPPLALLSLGKHAIQVWEGHDPEVEAEVEEKVNV